MIKLKNLKNLYKCLLEELKYECKCGITYEEKEMIINGIPIKASVCPKCGHMIYSVIEIQACFNNLNPIT